MFNCHPEVGLDLGLVGNNSRRVSFCSLSLGVQKVVDQKGRVWCDVWEGGAGDTQISHMFSLSLVSDKMFPALGFGAQLPPDWKVSVTDSTSFG